MCSHKYQVQLWYAHDAWIYGPEYMEYIWNIWNMEYIRIYAWIYGPEYTYTIYL